MNNVTILYNLVESMNLRERSVHSDHSFVIFALNIVIPLVSTDNQNQTLYSLHLKDGVHFLSILQMYTNVWFWFLVETKELTIFRAKMTKL